MALANKHEVTTSTITLNLDETEAGYLLDALLAHLGGRLVAPDQPLGQISDALKSAGVERLRAVNNKGRNTYASIYASNDPFLGEDV